MEVLRVGFVGVRTSNVRSTTAFFRDVLNLDVLRDDPNWAILQLPTGQFDFVEVYASDFSDERLIPKGVDAMVAFTVADLATAHEEVRDAGIEVSALVWAQETFDDPALAGYGWFFLDAPDGNTYVIQQAPA
jgi:catechol 2,3-dioxygenase-like lactoylglutathione lyase family enzyme